MGLEWIDRLPDGAARNNVLVISDIRQPQCIYREPLYGAVKNPIASPLQHLYFFVLSTVMVDLVSCWLLLYWMPVSPLGFCFLAPHQETIIIWVWDQNAKTADANIGERQKKKGLYLTSCGPTQSSRGLWRCTAGLIVRLDAHPPRFKSCEFSYTVSLWLGSLARS